MRPAGVVPHNATFLQLTEAIVEDITRQRVGEMRQIISTITPEQYGLITQPPDGALVVQGGPGTGKTVVALHRAAYLLYTHRFPLERSGVLLVGPNRIFLRYIEAVLPALGEHNAALRAEFGGSQSQARRGCGNTTTSSTAMTATRSMNLSR